MKSSRAKKFLSLVLAVVMVLALAACGNKTNDDNNTNNDNNTATDFPTKPMTIVCPYGAGGGTDLALRILAECGKDVFGQTINVENKTGGSGTVGLTEALNAAADGYTLGTCSVDLITLPLLGLAPAETTRDAFDPICVINGEPAAIIVRADSRWNTIEEFIAEAKEKPGTVQLANSGMGNIWHLAAIGIELETYFPEASVWTDDYTTGNFEIMMNSVTGASITNPFYRCKQFMYGPYADAEINYQGNYGHYHNDEADEILDKLATETDEATLKQYYTRLNEIYLTDVPSFGLMYRPDMFYTVNESVWTGYPMQDDESNIPPTDCTDGYGIAALYNLELVEG